MTPRLWVWVGAPDDKLDVLRYVHATDKDILRQPVVFREMESMRAKIAELQAFRDRVVALMEESVGVAGLHLNGDVAAWESLIDGGRFGDWLGTIPGEG